MNFVVPKTDGGYFYTARIMTSAEKRKLAVLDAIRRRLMRIPGIIYVDLTVEKGTWWAKVYSANDAGWHKVSDLLKRSG